MKNKSEIFKRCEQMVAALDYPYPIKVLEILAANYGKRIKGMKEKTIVDMVVALTSPVVYKEQIRELVKDWLNN